MVALVRWTALLFGVILSLLTGSLVFARQADPAAALLTYATFPADTPLHQVYIQRPGGRAFRITDGWGAWLPRWSPDGRWIAFLSLDSSRTLAYITRPNGTQTRRIPTEEQVINYHWSPDSQRLLLEVMTSQRRHTLLIWHLASDQIIPITFADSEAEAFIGHYPSAWSPDGQEFTFTLMTHDFDFQLWRGDLAGNQTAIFGEAYSPVWSPDGAWIAFVYGDQGVFKIRPDGSDVQRITPDHQDETSLIWAGDSTHLLTEAVFDHPPGGFIVTDQSTQRLPRMINQLAGWSPDMEWVAFSSLPDHQLYRIRSNGTQLETLTSFPVRTPDWSPPINLPLHTLWLVLLALISTLIILVKSPGKLSVF